MSNNDIAPSTKYAEFCHTIDLAIVKATVQDDGSMRWQAVASETTPDKADERTSIALFSDWVERIEKNITVSFLPPPRLPFLGISHYPALDGFGEAGITDKMFIDGDKFKASGVFYPDDDHPLGRMLFDAVREEKSLIKKGETVERPIRISAGWYDLQHAHGDFVFTRKSLSDKCPMCEQGVKNKVYLKGQVDHWAATRVPMHPETALGLEEKSMATRKEDAETIIDPEMAKELDNRAKVVGKSETESELPEGMVVKASTFGDFVRSKREELELSVSDIEGDLPITASTISSIENGEIETPSMPVIEAFAKALKVSKKELLSKLPKGAMPAEAVAKNKSEVEKAKGDAENPDGESPLAEAVKGEFAEAMSMMPLGGATSIEDAEAFIVAQEKKMVAVSNWHLLQDVMSNIRRRGELDPTFDQAAAMAQTISETGSRIAALKSSLEDAYLLSPMEQTGAQPVIDTPHVERGEIMSGTEAQVVEKSGVDQIFGDTTLTREAKTQAIQAHLNEYADTLKARLDQVSPPDQTQVMADALKSALGEAIAPLAEKVGLLTAKMDNQQVAAVQAPQMAMPVQKSVNAGANVAPTVEGSGLPVSPSTGQPSALTAHIRKSVGLQQ